MTRSPLPRSFAAILLAVIALFASDLAGSYKGTWSGVATGDFRIVLTRDGGEWKADVTFTMGSDEFKTKTKSVKVDGKTVQIVYEYDLQGNQMQSAISGELKGTTLEGTYKATTVGDGSVVDEGTWKTAAEKK